MTKRTVYVSVTGESWHDVCLFQDSLFATLKIKQIKKQLLFLKCHLTVSVSFCQCAVMWAHQSNFTWFEKAASTLTRVCACLSVSMETRRTGSTGETCWNVDAFKARDPRVTRRSAARRQTWWSGSWWNLRCLYLHNRRLRVTLETNASLIMGLYLLTSWEVTASEERLFFFHSCVNISLTPENNSEPSGTHGCRFCRHHGVLVDTVHRRRSPVCWCSSQRESKADRGTRLDLLCRSVLKNRRNHNKTNVQTPEC